MSPRRKTPRATYTGLFEEQAKRTPERPALVTADRSLSYAQLDARANALAEDLARLGLGPEVVIGVSMERSPRLVIALLAILKTGACYLPLDPGLSQRAPAFS